MRIHFTASPSAMKQAPSLRRWFQLRSRLSIVSLYNRASPITSPPVSRSWLCETSRCCRWIVFWKSWRTLLVCVNAIMQQTYGYAYLMMPVSLKNINLNICIAWYKTWVELILLNWLASKLFLLNLFQRFTHLAFCLISFIVKRIKLQVLVTVLQKIIKMQKKDLAWIFKSDFLKQSYLN